MQKKTTVPDFGTAVLLYGNDAQTVLLRGGGKCRALLLCRAGQHDRLRESFCGERAGTKAGNKGFECGVGAIEMVNVLRQL